MPTSVIVDRVSLVRLVIKRMLDGRKVIPIAFAGQNRFHSCAATNIAELIVSVLENLTTIF